MIRTKKVQMIDLSDWDDLVIKTYDKPYSFQQQEGCKSRGIVYLTVPSDYDEDEYMNDDIPEEVNGSEMGVKFETWLARDKDKPMKNQEYDFELDLFWSRNFYPCYNKLANDLHEKGLIEAGEYMINIDW